MVGVSIPVIMMASVCFYVGFYHLWMFFRRRQELDNFAFALMCFSITLYDAFCVGLYNADTVAQGMFWQKFQFASLALFSASLLWFVYFFIRHNNKKPFYIISAILFILFVLGFVLTNNELTLSINNPMPKKVVLGNIINVTYNEVDPGPVYLGQYVTMIAGFIYLIVLIVKYYNESNRRHVRPILIALSSFFIAAVNDVLVGAAVYPFVYVLEYIYLFIILSMAYGLLNRFVDLHQEVEDLNVHLEDKVKLRTEELQAAMEEMEAMNDTLRKTNLDLEEAQKVAARDMQMAVNVQSNLLKKMNEEPLGWDVAYVFKPMAGVSGDLFDFYIKDGNLKGVSIFDVSGHGISSGLITLLAKSIFFRNFTEADGLPLNKIIENANRELRIEIGNVDNFLTGIILRILQEGMVEYVNAGHSDLLIKRPEKNTVSIVKPDDTEIRGPLLGLKELDGEFNTVKFKMAKNDSLLLFTDALVESKNDQREEYGLERIIGSLKATAKEKAQDLLDDILKSFFNFTGTDDLDDDLTVIVIRRK